MEPMFPTGLMSSGRCASQDLPESRGRGKLRDTKDEEEEEASRLLLEAEWTPEKWSSSTSVEGPSLL